MREKCERVEAWLESLALTSNEAGVTVLSLSEPHMYLRLVLEEVSKTDSGILFILICHFRSSEMGYGVCGKLCYLFPEILITLIVEG